MASEQSSDLGNHPRQGREFSFKSRLNMAGNHRSRAFRADGHNNRVSVNQCRRDKRRAGFIVNNAIGQGVGIKNLDGGISYSRILRRNISHRSLGQIGNANCPRAVSNHPLINPFLQSRVFNFTKDDNVRRRLPHQSHLMQSVLIPANDENILILNSQKDRKIIHLAPHNMHNMRENLL